ncbi:helicase-related protein [Xylophilus sp. GOD-11R]|uniref:helicase-related protein n=1 Tax=Xylophilus sp. GOD-11R TaxID=3089814 RepID=UPI00298BFF07|nr:helicase-related protein [Xylophilus sp. GOD-11R]WPB56438.1 helicase-related protein [Xylophilus sp. GOD-11R]
MTKHTPTEHIDTAAPAADALAAQVRQLNDLLARSRATLIKTDTTVAYSVKGEVTVDGHRVEYALIPPDGVLAQLNRWVKMAPHKQVAALAERLHEHTAADFEREVTGFVMNALRRAAGAGVETGAYCWDALQRPRERADIAFQLALDRIDAAAVQRKASLAADRTRESINLARFPDTFRAAAGMRRKIIALLGPTNSGKTHEAMLALQSAKSGVYLAPLRLLALENYERLRAAGVAVSLITGEERRVQAGASHIASTVEMLDVQTPVDVAVIDEIQMLGDADRGAAWTAAVCGVPAATVYLVGSAAARAAIESLAGRLGCECEVRILDRKSKLAMGEKPLESLRQLKAGDAVIAFSRREVLQLAEQVSQAGFSVATIYGNLSPEVRRAQAEAFRSGQAQVVVATDAIGMGLNLPIARVIFTTATKYDGTEDGPVPAWLVQQIGGRAGRFGLAETGTVLGLGGPVHKAIRKLLAAPLEPIPRTGFYVAPSMEHLTQIGRVTGEQRLLELLALFRRNIDVHDVFFVPTSLAEQSERARWLDGTRMTLEQRFLFSLVPLATRIPKFQTLLWTWARAVEQQRPSRIDAVGLREGRSSLQDAEDACRTYSAYAWLSYRMPELFPEGAAAVEMAVEASIFVNDMLKRQNRGGERQHRRARAPQLAR